MALAFTSFMVHCNCCFQVAPVCTHGDNPATPCAFFTPDAGTARQANGDYLPSFRSTLPTEVRGLDASNIDSLYKYTPTAAVPTVLTVEETALAADLTTLSFTNMGHVLSLVGKRPGLLSSVKTAILLLLNTATTAPQSAICSNGLQEIDRLVARQDVLKDKGLVGSTTSTQAYQQSTFPKATLFQTIVRTVEKGPEIIAPTEATYLDAATGKVYIPFGKSTKVTSPENFMYCLMIFVTTSCQISNEAPFVYFSLQKEMKRACLIKGHVAAQAYLDAFLRTMDSGVFTNPLAIIAAGEHNRIYDEVMTMFSAKVPDKDRTKDPLDPRKRITFGKVTTPLGGKGAGVISNWTTGDKMKCNRFHSTPQKECSAGVPAGDPRFTADQVGLCAYLH